MNYFASLPADAGVSHILALNPGAGQDLVMFHSAALRNDVHVYLIGATRSANVAGRR